MDEPKRIDDRTLYMRRWREKNRAKNDRYQAAWKKAHRTEIALYNKLYRRAHAKEHRERNARWREANRERFDAGLKVAAAKRRYPGDLCVADVLAVIEKSGRRCHWCGKSKLKGRDLTLEHLKPVNDLAHLTVACLSCNAARLALKGY
jgi:hypothetical protein